MRKGTAGDNPAFPCAGVRHCVYNGKLTVSQQSSSVNKRLLHVHFYDFTVCWLQEAKGE